MQKPSHWKGAVDRIVEMAYDILSPFGGGCAEVKHFWRWTHFPGTLSEGRWYGVWKTWKKVLILILFVLLLILASDILFPIYAS